MGTLGEGGAICIFDHHGGSLYRAVVSSGRFLKGHLALGHVDTLDSIGQGLGAAVVALELHGDLVSAGILHTGGIGHGVVGRRNGVALGVLDHHRGLLRCAIVGGSGFLESHRCHLSDSCGLAGGVAAGLTHVLDDAVLGQGRLGGLLLVAVGFQRAVGLAADGAFRLDLAGGGAALVGGGGTGIAAHITGFVTSVAVGVLGAGADDAVVVIQLGQRKGAHSVIGIGGGVQGDILHQQNGVATDGGIVLIGRKVGADQIQLAAADERIVIAVDGVAFGLDGDLAALDDHRTDLSEETVVAVVEVYGTAGDDDVFLLCHRSVVAVVDGNGAAGDGQVAVTGIDAHGVGIHGDGAAGDINIVIGIDAVSGINGDIATGDNGVSIGIETFIVRIDDDLAAGDGQGVITTDAEVIRRNNGDVAVGDGQVAISHDAILLGIDDNGAAGDRGVIGSTDALIYRIHVDGAAGDAHVTFICADAIIIGSGADGAALDGNITIFGIDAR